MKTSTMTIVLLVLVILAAFWASGRASRLLNVIFAK